MAKPKLPSPAAATPPVALLTHSPSPGLYSRLERAIEALPSTVKTEGLRSRLQKHKEGVAGWELDPLMERVSHDAINRTVAGNGRPDITRRELLDMVHETSPAFTHRHGYLDEKLQYPAASKHHPLAGLTEQPRRLGAAMWSGNAEPGLTNYREHLLMQPTPPIRIIRRGGGPGRPGMESVETWAGGHFPGYNRQIAHMRVGEAGDALRLVELQSDIRNRNVKHMADGGKAELWAPSRIPLYDAYPEVFLKRLLLDAAQGGHRAIEIPNFDHISQYVHMRPQGIQHVYGSVVPNTLIRAAKPLGGLVDGPLHAREPVDPFAAVRRNDGRLMDAMDNLMERQQETFVPLVEMSGLPKPPEGEDRGGFYHIPWREFRAMTVPGGSEIHPVNLNRLRWALANAHAKEELVQGLRRAASDMGAPAYHPISEEDYVEHLLSTGEVPEWAPEGSYLRSLTPQQAMGRQQGLAMKHYAAMESRMPEIARAVEVAKDDYDRAIELQKQFQGAGKLPPEPKPIGIPSRRLELTDEFRRRAIRNGIPLGILAPMLLDQSQEASAKSGN